ncbi:Undecaprenyl-phosphate 4-deoxy-4-formamido-L-arabinose transferase [bioreactor metagenome]|uniref:Undecaprenyl-phosphate 4-deoxy-4-formamido-L-arabinose transferase n=1 Tax=bioreactor metagenome TaxID=1076179 RepID=A0A644SUY5_9ZZZZ|nr:glycosyltransferase [Negativicutes bacterium]
MPKISVIVPIFNCANYVSEALDSVCQQTLKDIEIICVNDGSTDNSPEIIANYSQKDARIKVIHKPNTGYGHTMNIGINEAKGKYIAVLEADDYLQPDFYASLYEEAEKSGAQLVRSDFGRFYDHEGRRKIEYCQVTYDDLYGKILNPQTLDIRIFRSAMMSWTGIVLRSFLNTYCIHHHETPGAAYQDNGFWFQMFCQADKILYLPKLGYMYRIDNPASSVHNRSRLFSMNEEYAFIYGFLQHRPDLHKFLGIYWMKKYENNLFTLRRIDKQYQEIYLKHFQEEFKAAEAKGELDKKYFLPEEWCDVEVLLKTPELYLEKIYAAQYGYPYDQNLPYPAISIAVITGQHVQALHKSIQSLLNQTFGSFEIILLDDTTSEAVTQYCLSCCKHDRFVYVNTVSAARYQEALLKARGCYITFIDAGDTVKPEFLDILYSFTKQEQIELVSCSYEYNEDKARTQRLASSPPIKVTGEMKERMLFEMNFSAWGVLWGKLYSRQLLTRVWWSFLTGKEIYDNRLVAFSAAVQANGYIILPQCHYQRQYSQDEWEDENLPAVLTLLWKMAKAFGNTELLPKWGTYFLGSYWEEKLEANYQQSTLNKKSLAETSYLEFIKEML